jgi:flavorubredoxin
MPYGDQVKKALATISKLHVDMIAPSHGIIWRSSIPEILKEYTKWANYETNKSALIVYDSMWGSTEKIAYALQEGIQESGIHVKNRNLKTNHISDIMTDMLRSKLILIGSPTLNNGMMPSIGSFLTYVKGLRPRNRVGYVFGSYGWGGQAVNEIENIMKELAWDMPFESVNVNYIPDDETLTRLKKIGNELGKYIKT